MAFSGRSRVSGRINNRCEQFFFLFTDRNKHAGILQGFFIQNRQQALEHFHFVSSRLGFYSKKTAELFLFIKNRLGIFFKYSQKHNVFFCFHVLYICFFLQKMTGKEKTLSPMDLIYYEVLTAYKNKPCLAF